MSHDTDDTFHYWHIATSEILHVSPDPDLAAEAWSAPDPLTDRERQALRFAGEGKTSAEIASMFCLSEGTVRNYLSEAMSAGEQLAACRIAAEPLVGQFPPSWSHQIRSRDL